ncbi:MAG: prolipoprotein diacylglyceryl transferase [Planctomycetaceae bacterium]
MRQVLLWLSLKNPWSAGTIDGIEFVGAAYLWLIVGLVGIGLAYARRRVWPLRDWTGALVIWGVAGVVIHTAFSVTGLAALPIYGYGFMLFVAFVAGGWLATGRAKSVQMDPNWIWDAGLWMFVGGIFGARLFYCVQYPKIVFGGKSGLPLLLAFFDLPSGGIVLYGGVIGGGIAFFLFCHRKKISPLKLADVLAPSVFVGLMFGRIGCLLNGCCFGDRCELPWAIEFAKGSVPYDVLLSRGFLTGAERATFPLHPTQVYSAINALFLAILLTVYYPRRSRDGAVLALGWIIYPVTRFMIEFLRGDEMGKFGTSFTIAQWVGVGLFVSGLVFWQMISRQPQNSNRMISSKTVTGNA